MRVALVQEHRLGALDREFELPAGTRAPGPRARRSCGNSRGRIRRRRRLRAPPAVRRSARQVRPAQVRRMVRMHAGRGAEHRGAVARASSMARARAVERTAGDDHVPHARVHAPPPRRAARSWSKLSWARLRPMSTRVGVEVHAMHCCDNVRGSCGRQAVASSARHVQRSSTSEKHALDKAALELAARPRCRRRALPERRVAALALDRDRRVGIASCWRSRGAPFNGAVPVADGHGRGARRAQTGRC